MTQGSSRAPGPPSRLRRAIGGIPYRIALAGGWIDQPFVSRLNPHPPGSMVVVAVEPDFRFMDRSGMASGTRAVAEQRWGGRLPRRNPAALVRELYAIENAGKSEPSGSQDMIGLLYPGINRLDFDARVDDGIFPAHIETLSDRAAERWIERVLHVLPVAPRPPGYNPLGRKRLDPRWIDRLGRSGADCFEAIRRQEVAALGTAMNECMRCWHRLLPDVLQHPTLTVDLVRLLKAYQSVYPGAMYSGCGGGYLLVASETPVPGAFHIRVRTR